MLNKLCLAVNYSARGAVTCHGQPVARRRCIMIGRLQRTRSAIPLASCDRLAFFAEVAVEYDNAVQFK